MLLILFIQIPLKFERMSANQPLRLGRYAKLDADGTLHLPPITDKPKFDDPYGNSKLLTFSLSRQKETHLRQMM